MCGGTGVEDAGAENDGAGPGRENCGPYCKVHAPWWVPAEGNMGLCVRRTTNMRGVVEGGGVQDGVVVGRRWCYAASRLARQKVPAYG